MAMVWRLDRAEVTCDGRRGRKREEKGAVERGRVNGSREVSRTSRRLRSGDVDVKTWPMSPRSEDEGDSRGIGAIAPLPCACQRRGYFREA
jgi:hypothetical protein